MKLTKYLCCVLMIKGKCYIMEFVRWLIFIKIMSQVVKRLKKIVIKKSVINEILIKKIVIEKILIIKKDCND